MIGYSFIADDDKKTIHFWTNDEELYDDVCKYIQNCVDAKQWQNRVERFDRKE